MFSNDEKSPLFPRYAMNPNLQIFLNKSLRYGRIPDENFKEDYKLGRKYYKPSQFPKIFAPRNLSFYLLIFSVFLFFAIFLVLFRGKEDRETQTQQQFDLFSAGKNYSELGEQAMTEIPIEAQTFGIPEENVKSALKNYLDSIDPAEKYPDDVNFVKPHHIKVIGAMGDSLTIGSRAQNHFVNYKQRYPGNAFFTGMDAKIDQHLTIYNIFRYIADKTGSKLFGGSTGEDYGTNTGFNVAVGGRTSGDILRQAMDLVERVKANSEIDINHDWKLVSLWIGTNDVGNLGYGIDRPIPVDLYKQNIEKGIEYLKKNLPRTIVSIIGMFPAQLLQEAQSIITTGKRAKTEENQKKLDALSDGYRKAEFEIQNEEKFEDKEFTVVVQPFAIEYNTVYIDNTGASSTSFYAVDLFHLSKLGHAIIAKHYWQNLFEGVGSKTTKAELGNTSQNIFELNKENCFIKTIGNSKK